MGENWGGKRSQQGFMGTGASRVYRRGLVGIGASQVCGGASGVLGSWWGPGVFGSIVGQAGSMRGLQGDKRGIKEPSGI